MYDLVKKRRISSLEGRAYCGIVYLGEREDSCCVQTTIIFIDNSKFYSFYQYSWVLSVSCWVFLNKELLNKCPLVTISVCMPSAPLCQIAKIFKLLI